MGEKINSRRRWCEILILSRKRGGTLEKTEWKLGLTTSREIGSMELKEWIKYGGREEENGGSASGKGKVGKGTNLIYDKEQET